MKERGKDVQKFEFWDKWVQLSRVRVSLRRGAGLAGLGYAECVDERCMRETFKWRI